MNAGLEKDMPEREGEGEIQFGREFAIYNVCMGVHY